MPYIKELVIHGFKSFPRETRIPFKNSMNAIVGPNGSGKSNITDSICFVLGRLGSKSMRAKRLSNLIFAGTQKYKPSSEASVEMIFDNADKGFSLAEKEVSIKRILRKNGQGIYKINGEIKTRQEVLELLAQAGIDPNGFNIVLQGEIDSFVKMTPEQRREIIEEVAGISIYEIRKQHSIHELEKTEQRLKEVSATLRERHAYLRNLEEERKQALHFKKLQSDICDFKASILNKIIAEKQQKINDINIQLKKHQDEIAKLNDLVEKNNKEISLLNEKINHITNDIQKESGLEQEKLNTEISDLRADLAGITITKQNLETKISETKKRKEEIEQKIFGLEQEIRELGKSRTGIRTKDIEKEIIEKKKYLEEIDEKRRKLLVLKSNLSALNPRFDDKKRQIQKAKNEADFTLNRIREEESQLKMRESFEQHQESMAKIKPEFDKLKKEIDEANKSKMEHEKIIAALERQIQELGKIKSNIFSFDTCPLCKTKMTKEHVSKVIQEANEQEAGHKKEIFSSSNAIKEAETKVAKIYKEIEKFEQELKIRSQDILRIRIIDEKKTLLKKISEEQKELEKEYSELEAKKSSFEKQILSVKTSEENYDHARLELQELERREEKTIGIDITSKQRDVERLKLMTRQAQREIEDAVESLSEVASQLEEKQDLLSEKNEQDEMLKIKFKKILEEKNQHQEKIRFYERDIMHKQNDKQIIEQTVNELKINRARVSAEKESSEIEAKAAELKDARIIKLSIDELKIKLDETQRILQNIGTVNLRSLEVYEGIKQEYDKIQEKAETIKKEREDIMKVIEDIDKKKKKVFIKTLNDINILFSRNFSQLSTKGIASLEPVDNEDPFKEGIEMLIKVGKGKYFDTHSLSGGEKSLISLSLIFAIQEYKPYCFYIFDEIDAALDKRNSERLSTLLKRYMKNGQYIVITHNDSLITEAPNIYGVVMQDKISSVFSMEV